MLVIVLGGIKHTGKSTVGRILSKEMELPFHDLDDLILKILPFKWSVRKWFREKGADAFKKKEAEALRTYFKEAAGEALSILSLGGGTLENAEALKLLKNSEAGIFILDEEEEILFERIIQKGIPPFLDGDNPRASFSKLYKTRRATLLEQGDHIINIHGLDQQEAAEKAVQVIRSVYGW
jgi:shikimate kinase